MKMKTLLILLSCIQLLAISLDHHLILSKGKGLTLQQLQGVEGVGVDSGITEQVKYELKAGKGPYGGANMNRDPRASKSKASSSELPWGFCISIGISISVRFFVSFLFGF